LNTYNCQPPNARYNEKGQRVLPGGGGGARFIPPDEYKEFLQLGHGGIFDLDLDNIDLSPWRERGVDSSAYFNYGLDERSWRKYVKGIRKARLELHVQNEIETYTLDATGYGDLPIEVRRAIGGWELATERASRDDAVADFHGAASVSASTGVPYQLLNTTTETAKVPKEENDTLYSNCEESDRCTSFELDGSLLQELKKQVEEIQNEYRQLLHEECLTNEKSLELQQKMVDIKMRMVAHSNLL